MLLLVTELVSRCWNHGLLQQDAVPSDRDGTAGSAGRRPAIGRGECRRSARKLRAGTALAAATGEWTLVLLWVTSYTPFLVGCALTHIVYRVTVDWWSLRRRGIAVLGRLPGQRPRRRGARQEVLVHRCGRRGADAQRKRPTRWRPIRADRGDLLPRAPKRDDHAATGPVVRNVLRPGVRAPGPARHSGDRRVPTRFPHHPAVRAEPCPAGASPSSSSPPSRNRLKRGPCGIRSRRGSSTPAAEPRYHSQPATSMPAVDRRKSPGCPGLSRRQKPTMRRALRSGLPRVRQRSGRCGCRCRSSVRTPTTPGRSPCSSPC